MAWPGTLTAEEQTSLLAWVNACRTFAGEMARLNNHLDAVNTEYNGPQNNTNGYMSKLAGSDVIPNTSGLVDAEPITKDQLISVIAYFQGVLNYNSTAHRQNLARLCGEHNLIG